MDMGPLLSTEVISAGQKLLDLRDNGGSSC
jgi:hypothetical protein